MKNKPQYLQILCPRGPIAAHKGGGHGARIKDDFSIEIQVAFAVIVGVADSYNFV